MRAITKNYFNSIILHDVTTTSKIASVTVAAVVTVMVGVVIAASLGTQDDMSETPDPPTNTCPV